VSNTVSVNDCDGPSPSCSVTAYCVSTTGSPPMVSALIPVKLETASDRAAMSAPVLALMNRNVTAPGLVVAATTTSPVTAIMVCVGSGIPGPTSAGHCMRAGRPVCTASTLDHVTRVLHRVELGSPDGRPPAGGRLAVAKSTWVVRAAVQPSRAMIAVAAIRVAMAVLRARRRKVLSPFGILCCPPTLTRRQKV
jgi:hypothetical protein